jgi:Spy/CpxP family protein refolding chaperone
MATLNETLGRWVRMPLLTLTPVVASLACVAALAQPAGMAPDGPPGMHPAMHHGPGMRGGESGMMGERMFDQVGVSAEQKAKIRDIMKAAHTDVEARRAEGRQLHQAMAAALAAPQVDAAAAEAVRQKLQAQRDAVSKRHLQAMLDVSAVLTPEQRQKLSERMRARHDMMERHHRERDAMEGRRG